MVAMYPPPPDRSASPDDRYEQFVLLFARHQQSVFSFILTLVPTWADAEDVLQQTSVVLWQKFAEFQRGTDFAAWACSIARFKAMRLLRDRGRDRLVFSDQVLELLADESCTDLERLAAERRALGDCLAKLPADHRALVQRCYAPGATIKAVAADLGSTANRIYKLLNRLRDVLLRCIESRLAAEGHGT